jgi:hypothetical protein
LKVVDVLGCGGMTCIGFVDQLLDETLHSAEPILYLSVVSRRHRPVREILGDA